jgi:Polyphosphate kinase 2 (PPK2)
MIFNRSHYEDVRIVRVHNIVPKSVWSKRYDRIREFEKLLIEADTHTVKFHLHISPQEQLARFKERLEDPHRNWKIRNSDYTEREYWPAYIEAFEDAMRETSTNARTLVCYSVKPQVVSRSRDFEYSCRYARRHGYSNSPTLGRSKGNSSPVPFGNDRANEGWTARSSSRRTEKAQSEFGGRNCKRSVQGGATEQVDAIRGIRNPASALY